MKKHLEKIKKRPLAERKKLATIFATIVTLLIVIASFILGSVFKTKKKIKVNDDRVHSFEKMFNTMEEKFSKFGAELKEQKDTVKKTGEEIKKQTDTVQNIKEEKQTETVKY